jgi:hypothetical protein
MLTGPPPKFHGTRDILGRTTEAGQRLGTPVNTVPPKRD